MRTFGTFAVIFFFCALANLSASEPVTPDKTGMLTLESNEPDSKVYMDGEYIGNAPISLSGIEPGLHQILVLKDGYYDETYMLTITPGTNTIIKVSLRMITGRLVLMDVPENTDFELIVDGKLYKAHWLDLPEGSHEVTIREFGYIDRSQTVQIIRMVTSELNGKLVQAAFDASDLHAAKQSFNPDNPSNLGKLGFSFSVTAPGTGRIVIIDSTGAEVQAIDMPTFTTWKQNVLWDGKDTGGVKVKDGAYSIRLEASGTESSDTIAQEIAIEIDRTITYPFTGSDAGISSSGPVVSGSLMPRSGLLLNVGVSKYSTIFSPYISLTSGIFDFLEAGFRGETLIAANSNTAFKLSGGIKTGMKNGNARTALALTYRVQTASLGDIVPLNRNGFSLAPAFEYKTGFFTTGIYSALSWGNELGLFSAPYFTASLGLATRLILGNFSSSAWINDDTSPFGAEFRSLGTWTTGLSIQYIFPSTNLQISAEGGYWNDFDDGNIFFFRGGFGVLY